MRMGVNMGMGVSCLLLIWGLIASASQIASSSSISCRDENNNTVDWYYIYKLPRNKFSGNPLVKRGVAYMFITPDTVKNGWTLSSKSINDTDSMPALTIAELYQYSDDHISVIYNDQPPADSSKTTHKPNKTPKKTRKKIKTTSGGHTKGVVLSNDENGIWLIHSVPKFPALPGSENDVDPIKYSYPSTGTKYGQNFLCLSLNSETMDTVGVQLSYNEPKIIFSHVPDNLEYKFDTIVDVVNNKTVSTSPWVHIAKLCTRNGMTFESFAKSANFKDDLYEGLIAPYLKSDLLVETWINGPGVLKSNCSFKYKVNNIEKIAFAGKGVAFSSHNDHSKWAVSVPLHFYDYEFTTEADYWICVGDINRATSQELRGGGSVCTENEDIWKLYSDSVNSVEPCDV